MAGNIPGNAIASTTNITSRALDGSNNAANNTWDDASFFAEISKFHEEGIESCTRYAVWRSLSTRYYPVWRNPVQLWYGDAPYYLKIVDIPDTVSGNILRYKADLPKYNCHLEIHGNSVKEIEFHGHPDENFDKPEESRDFLEEDAKDLFMALPAVEVDEDEHFTKQARTRREIEVLMKCRGHPYIVQLLGRTDDEKLVFPRYGSDLLRQSVRNTSIMAIRDWMLDVIEALTFLHSIGYTHRDLAPRNVLHGKPVVLCDLECDFTSHRAPELLIYDQPPEELFTPATDIYGLGMLLQRLIYANNPRTPYIHWPVLPPFDKIYEACTQERPEDRPSLAQVKSWLQAI